MVSLELKIKPVVYDHIRHLVLPADIALSRPSSAMGHVVVAGSGEPYSHATMLGWAGAPTGGCPGRTLMLGDSRQWERTGLIDARSEIFAWPGYYDVYRVRSEIFDRDQAWDFMCRSGGTWYGWRNLARGSVRRAFGWPPPFANSDDPRRLRHCSERVHAALRAGWGPQINRFDCDVAPGDLADPKIVEYLWTLYANEDQVEEALAAMSESNLV